MKLIVNKDRTTIAVGTWGTVNENNYEILEFEFPAELEHFNKRIVYYLGDERVWDAIVGNKAYITNAITTKEHVKAYVWLTERDDDIEKDIDFRTQLFEMNFYENENADGIVPTEEQVDGFNTMLTAMNAKIDEVDALEQTIGAAEAERQEAEATRVSNENTRESNEATRQTNEQTRQTQEAERERRTDEAIADIEDKTAEYNANAEAKTNEFNQNATQKTNEFNSNYTQKVNDFNTNASSKESAFNSNASSKTSDFNSNAETKTNAFNTNATNKTNAFNSNATEKTTAFDDNASTKTSEFNTNAESKASAFNNNASQKTTNFDNNASEKTDEFNTNAQNKIDEYDEHIADYQAQIDELQEEVDELSENMPWNTTEQDTEISVDDAAKYSKNKLELFGNTEQAQYTGKNLFNVSDSSFQYGTLRFSLNSNIINIRIGSGTGGLSQNPQGEYTNYNFDTSKNYYFSVYQKEGDLLFRENTTTKWFRIVIYIKYDDNTISNNTLSITTGMDKKSVKVHFTEGKNPIAFAIGRYSPSNTLENNQEAEYYVQLEEGTEATDYEPYVGGQPAPSPDYPQPIHVVAGENIISVGSTNYLIDLRGKNKFDIAKITLNTYIGNNGITGTSTATNLSDYIYVQGNKEYTLSYKCDNFENPSNRSLVFYTSNKQYISGGYYNPTNKLFTFTPEQDGYVRFGYDINCYDIQVEEGDTATEYVPYNSLELCKIGDYQDYLYKENGNWYKYGAIKKIIFNGTETWRQSGVASAVHNINLKDMLPVANNNTAYNNGTSDQFKNGATYQQLTVGTYSNYYNRMSATNDKYMSFSYEFTTTTASWKEWLTTHNLTAYYVLETATSTQITDETLIAQLEAIYNHLALVKGTNHITITPSDLEPYVTLNYMQDLPSKLDNLDSRLSLLE